MASFTIKVTSDTICPWCYVGKKRLEKAIDMYKSSAPNAASDTFTITWHPFYLDPTLSTTSVERSEHLARKFGAERLPMMQAHLAAVGETVGIKFATHGKIGNTRDAHRLVQLAKTKSNALENGVVAELFRAHFEDGGDVTSQEMLVGAAEKAGLDREEAKRWLDEGKGGEEVDREVQLAYRRNVHGVPNFVINDRYEISGAEDPETFVQTFLRAKKVFG